ncbi:MAG: hypothetical protein OHK0017_02620 [Patescibacteria group bacterium]
MSDINKSHERVVFLIGSRTGGPLIPLLAVKDDLETKFNNLKFVIVGVKGGFEDKVSITENIPVLHLPEVKNQLTPDGLKGLSKAVYKIKSKILIGLGLIYSLCLSTYYLIKYRPSLILSTSNFLSVPIIWAAGCLNFLKFWDKQKINIAVHQLDPVNTTVKLIKPFANLLSAGFPSVVASLDSEAKLIPNPVRYNVFKNKSRVSSLKTLEETGILSSEKKVSSSKKVTTMEQLQADLRAQSDDLKSKSKQLPKPLLLVFGGGSGAEFINNWVWDNVKEITQYFKVLHLTGYLQKQDARDIKQEDYNQHVGLTDLMADALVASDYVIARAGMSTISELLFLRKQGFLIPIPDSHQEANADLVKEYFRIWKQVEVSNWLPELIQTEINHIRLSQKNFDYYNDRNLHDYPNILSRYLN